MKCIWEVEHEPSGTGCVIEAKDHDAMIFELKRIGFKSILTEEAQKTCVIDVMIAANPGGDIYSAMEYVEPLTIIRDVTKLPTIDAWPKPEMKGLRE